ncbi:MAG: hypothetical protein M3Y06_09010 [Actinomycetota bacterium]|nr:hypothetical protein [Actinomycetota bacterium]
MNRSVNLPKPLLVGLVVAELVSAAFAWRDLGRRSDNQIRGAKTGWRVFIALNPGNSLAYWAIGRR